MATALTEVGESIPQGAQHVEQLVAGIRRLGRFTVLVFNDNGNLIDGKARERVVRDLIAVDEERVRRKLDLIGSVYNFRQFAGEDGRAARLLGGGGADLGRALLRVDKNRDAVLQIVAGRIRLQGAIQGAVVNGCRPLS